MPLQAAGERFGALQFSTLGRRRGWSQALRRRLGLLATTFAYALARQRLAEKLARTEASLQRQQRFERLLGELSTDFINASGGQVDQAIERTQARVAHFLGVDRSSFWEGQADTQNFRLTHAYARPGLPLQTPLVPERDIPWIARWILGKRVLALSSLDDLPAEAVRDRASLQADGLRSLIALPIEVEGYVLCVLAFGAIRRSVDWPPEVIPRLQLIGEIIANALRRKRDDQALQTQQQRAKWFFDNALEGISRIDLAEPIPVDLPVAEQIDLIYRHAYLGQVNRAMAEQYNAASPAAFTDTPLAKLIPRDLTTSKPMLTQLIDAQYRLAELETVERTLDGAERIFINNVVGEIDRGRLTHVWTTQIDVTEQRRLAREARQLRDELSHLSRIATLSELTGALAHELNQPLAAILSNAQAAQRFLRQQPPDLDELRAILDDIVADDKRAGEVIRRLGQLMKKDTSRFVALDVNELIREVLALLRSEALIQRQRIVPALAPGLPGVVADRVQLQQVLLNLLVNAGQAMSEVREPLIELATRRRDGQTVEVAVRDYGPGISAEHFDQLFSPFFSTKANGLGLGLSINRTIISAFGGRLWAENNPDRGATFRFTLPIAPAAASGAGP